MDVSINICIFSNVHYDISRKIVIRIRYFFFLYLLK